MMATAPRQRSKLPPFIHPDDMPDRYAIPGIGTCMEPQIMDGSTLVFDKHHGPNPGDIVGLLFTQEAARRRGMPGWIKRLIMPPPPAGFDGLVIVEQVNPPRAYTLPTTDILAVHKCIGIAIPRGDGIAAFNPKNPWNTPEGE